jgi:hypothetical protein
MDLLHENIYLFHSTMRESALGYPCNIGLKWASVFILEFHPCQSAETHFLGMKDASHTLISWMTMLSPSDSKIIAKVPSFPRHLCE